MDALTIADQVNSGERTAVDVVEEALERIEVLDRDLRAFREVWPEKALAVARELGKTQEQRPLNGVPLGVKAWEKLDSPQVRRLVAAGCVPVGATSVPTGTPYQTWGHTDRGPTVNPWRPDRTPGGSSAGSAAAVAAGLVPLATGIDGAGSIRIPAAWCGVVGVKVTGGIAAPGPLARTVADAAAYLGIEPRESDISAIWSADLGYADVDAEIAAIAEAAAQRVGTKAYGLDLRDPAEAWFSLRDPAASDEARCRAAEVRAGNDRRLDAAFAVADVLLTPTAPFTAHGHDGPGDALNVALTWAFNLSGHPAASVPVGIDAEGVPVGLQIVGRRGEEATVLYVAGLATMPGIGGGARWFSVKPW